MNISIKLLDINIQYNLFIRFYYDNSKLINYNDIDKYRKKYENEWLKKYNIII